MKLSTVFTFQTQSKMKNVNPWGRILLAPISLCFLQCEIKQIVRTAISCFYVQNKNCGYFQQKQCELNVKKGENSKSTALCFVNQSEFVSDPKKFLTGCLTLFFPTCADDLEKYLSMCMKKELSSKTKIRLETNFCNYVNNI